MNNQHKIIVSAKEHLDLTSSFFTCLFKTVNGRCYLKSFSKVIIHCELWKDFTLGTFCIFTY